MPKFSVIITAKQEEKTVGRAIEAFLSQMDSQKGELIVISPDEKTLAVAQQYSKKIPFIKVVRDIGKGKPTALNQALKVAKSEIIILSDGDVYVDKQALASILKSFANLEVGLVTGRPVSLNKKNNLFGFWSHLLTEIAHQIRSSRVKAGQIVEGSGYLLAFRRRLINRIPRQALAEDIWISRTIFQKGFLTDYAPQAKVYVCHPTNYQDWLKQKIRSTGGTQQSFVVGLPKMRSFRQEIRGIFRVITYPRSLKEFYWVLLLLLARLDLWRRIFIRVKIRKESFATLWRRVESTKNQ